MSGGVEKKYMIQAGCFQCTFTTHLEKVDYYSFTIILTHMVSCDLIYDVIGGPELKKIRFPMANSLMQGYQIQTAF